MNKRFIIPETPENEDTTLIDTKTGKEYTDNFEDIVKVMNQLAEENIILDMAKTTQYRQESHLRVELHRYKDILQDFMNILNEIQYYFQKKEDYKELDHKDSEELYILSNKARDMLTLMDMKIKKRW